MIYVETHKIISFLQEIPLIWLTLKEDETKEIEKCFHNYALETKPRWTVYITMQTIGCKNMGCVGINVADSRFVTVRRLLLYKLPKIKRLLMNRLGKYYLAVVVCLLMSTTRLDGRVKSQAVWVVGLGMTLDKYV